MAPATPAQVQLLNIAYFGRPADPNSLTAWGAAGVSPEQIVLAFVATNEYKISVAPFFSDSGANVDFTGLISFYYRKIFGRDAQAVEVQGWTQAILSGAVNFDYLGITIANAGLNLPDGTDIKNVLLAKLASANTFSAELAADPSSAAAYVGASAVGIGVDYLDTVITSTPATPAEAAIFIAQLTAETFVLTPGAQTLRGGSGNTTFEAAAEQTAFLPIQTLNNGDRLDGGGGRNTLNAQLVDVFTTPTLLSNIQEVNLSGAGGLVPLLIPATLNVINADAIDTIGFRSPTNLFGGIQVTNLKTALDTVNITDDFLGTDFGIQFIGSALVGDDDSLDINLVNAQGSTLVLDNDTGFYETINVNSGGFLDNEFTLVANGDGPVEMFVTGNIDLEITGDALLFDTIRLFDASGLNANLFAEFDGGDADGADVELIGAQGDTEFEIDGPGNANLFITTFDGDDDIDVWDFDGNITAVLGDGDNIVEIEQVDAFGGLAGDVSVVTGEGNDDFIFDDIKGDVFVNGGDGDNDYEFNLIDGDVDAIGGTGIDNFVFLSDVTAIAGFGPDDSVDGGAGDEDRLAIELNSAVDADLLVDGVGANIMGIEIIEHFGVISPNDLLVDFSLSGSATILELGGVYQDDVRISGLDFEAGDVVRVFSNITDDLVLVNAPLSVGGYRLELSDVTIFDELQVGDGTSDVLRLVSLGDTNIIEDASAIDARISLTGDQNIQIGSDGAEAYNLDDGLIDATELDGSLRTFLGLGNQTVNDSTNDDQIWSLGNVLAGSSDIINLSEGDDIVGFDSNAGFFGISLNPNIAGQTLVNGFVNDSDLIALKVSGPGADISLTTTTGFALAGSPDGSAETLSTRAVVAGEVANLQATSFNFLKFTTAAAGQTTVDGLFDSVIGAGALTVADSADLLGAAYDTSGGVAVLFRINNTDTTITSTDRADGIATIAMSYDEFLAFDSIAFLNNYGPDLA